MEDFLPEEDMEDFLPEEDIEDFIFEEDMEDYAPDGVIWPFLGRAVSFNCSVCKHQAEENSVRCISCLTPVHIACLIKSETLLRTRLFVSKCKSYNCEKFPRFPDDVNRRFRHERSTLPPGYKPLDVESPCAKIVHLLLNFGASSELLDNSSETVLHKAIRANNIPVVTLLVEEENYLVHCRFFRNEIALHFAARHGSLEVIKIIVENTEDINSADCLGQTPIFMAASRGDLEIIKYLHKKGSNILKETCDGRTLLHRTVWHRHYEATKWLLENGLSWYHLDNRQVAPLMCALADGYEPILMLCKDWYGKQL